MTRLMGNFQEDGDQLDSISKEVAEANSHQGYQADQAYRSPGPGSHIDNDGSDIGQILASSLSRSKTVAGGSVTSGSSF